MAEGPSPDERLPQRFAPLRQGDEVLAADELSVGDIIYFERLSSSRVVARVLTHDLLANRPAHLFELTAGDRPGLTYFREIGLEDLE